VFVVIIVTLCGGSILAVSAMSDGAMATTQPSVTENSMDAFDSTTFDITVHENGTATWTFTYERVLQTQSDEAEFQAFAEEFETEESDLYARFVDQSQALTASGAEATGREMEATDHDRSATIDYRPNAMGVVEMEFTWSNFAAVTDDTVIVGDVFDGGLYIGPSQTLTIRPGDGLMFSHTDPEGQYTDSSLEESAAVSWRGETDFPDGQPQVVFEPRSADGASGADGDGTGSDGADGDSVEGDGVGSDTGSERGGDGTPISLALSLLALGAVGVAAVLAWRRYQAADDSQAVTTQPAPESAASSEPITETELMTDEDRVVSLIKRNGGRMKQVNIVEETGWSKSKVSMLLSEMEDEETISKLRVGRENIISLRGFEPEATKSPFEE